MRTRQDEIASGQNPVDVLEKLLRDNGCEIDEEAFAEARKLCEAPACENPVHVQFVTWATKRMGRMAEYLIVNRRDPESRRS